MISRQAGGPTIVADAAGAAIVASVRPPSGDAESIGYDAFSTGPAD
ncbi:hypothetical protein [Burkholderia singularis]|nr:hypothetical protein [Burkholderia singularis]